MTLGDDTELALQLAQRLLAHPHPFGGYPTVELFPGHVPDDSRIEVIVPSASRVLGAAVERRDGDLSAVQAIIDVDQPLPAAMEAYERDLAGAGWTAANFGPAGGFMPFGGGPPQMYQKSETGPLLMVHPLSRAANATELRLRLDFSAPRQRPPRHQRPEGMELMPALYAPPGVEMEGGGGGGGDAHWSSQATAKTNMPLPELEGFFARQLSRSGWTRLSGGSAEVTAWSSWKIAGKDDWRGLLIVLASPEDDERWLTVYVQRRSHRGRGWASAVSGFARH